MGHFVLAGAFLLLAYSRHMTEIWIWTNRKQPVMLTPIDRAT